MIPKVNSQTQKINDIFIFPKSFFINENKYTEVFINRMLGLGYHCFKGKQIIRLDRICIEDCGYMLHIKNGEVVLKAGSDCGFYYGLVTLFQMIVESNGKLTCGEYVDNPRFEYRGVMLDVCRHFFDKNEIKRIIDQMSLLKLNKFHWHLSNDQGYRIESKVFPKLNSISSFRKLDEFDPLVENGTLEADSKYGGYYTFEDVGEILAYAKVRYVEVIPEIELPGHATAILSAFNELTCSEKEVNVASTFGIHERIFCVGNERVYGFIDKLLDEVCSLFDSEYIHIGGDEVPKQEWKNCPKCNETMRKNGLKGFEELQCYFTNRVIEKVKSLNKKPIVWNESAVSDNLDNSAIVQYWMEMAPGESYVTKEFSKGRKFILSNQCQFYCDYSYAETPLRATLNFEPQVKGNIVPNENVLGIEAPMWTEWTAQNDDIEMMLYPRMLAVAECGWTINRNTDDFMKRAKTYLQNFALNILRPMRWERVNIGGEEALKMIAEKMLELSYKHGRMAQKEGKTINAVVHDDAPMIDPQIQVYQYMKSKMEAAYTDEDVKKVLQLISALRSGL